MEDLDQYRGLHVFGPAYEVLYRNDPHPSGSVDRRIQERMVLLCAETAPYLYAEYTPTTTHYEPDSHPELERVAQTAIREASSPEERVAALAAFTHGLVLEEEGLEEMRFGGTEDEIIRRGSDWCTDLARVGCALCQVVGIPARLVALADVEAAYTGHMIVEAFREGVWGATDLHTNVVYRHPDGHPATTWDLQRDPALIERHYRDETTPYAVPEIFRAAAISNYFLWRWREYDYGVGSINDYYRAILGMAEAGWTGGIRWLHGEDETGT